MNNLDTKLLALKYGLIYESKYSKVAIKTLDKIPSLLRELKNIKSEYDKRYIQWLSGNYLKDSKYNFFLNVVFKEIKVAYFLNKILDVLLGGKEAAIQDIGLAGEEFIQDLESFLEDYVINAGNVPIEVLDRIVDNLFEMLDVTRTAYPTSEFTKMFLNFLKMYPKFADGSGYNDAIIGYNRWPGKRYGNDDVQFENTQKKAHKLQQIVNRDEQVKLKINEWNEALGAVITNLDKIELLTDDVNLKAFYYKCLERMDRGEDLESYEEDFVMSAMGIDENLIEFVRRIGFK
jgi:hypothetical protein